MFNIVGLVRRPTTFVTQTTRNCSYFIDIMSQKALARGEPMPPLTPGRMRMYNMRFCPFAQRTRMVLEYKGIPHEIVNCNLKKKPIWLFERNPNGLVPVLEKDDIVVYESNVCNEYLDEIYPEPRLIPRDTLQKTRDKMLSEGFGKMTSMFYEIPSAFAKNDGTFEGTVKRFNRGMQFYDKELGKRGKFFGGDTPCMVDFTIWPWFERLDVLTVIAPETELTKATAPHLSAWVSRMMDLPAVKSSYLPPEEHIHFFKTLREGAPDYDRGLAL